jgi:hypothetical protein
MNVYITTRTVGSYFATAGQIRRVGDKRILWDANRDGNERAIAPYGFTSAAASRAEAEAARRGWTVVEAAS